jgi:predicted RNA methylase
MNQVLNRWVADGLLPCLDGAVVWDLGCGTGEFAEAFAEEGAEWVFATDIHLDRAHMGARLNHPKITFLECDVDSAAPAIYAQRPPDVVFLHLVTEHVGDLRAFLRALRVAIGATSPHIFLHHDNYYQPVGHHDHPFLSLDPASNAIAPRAVRCWDDPARCAASAAHRAELLRDRSWQYGPESDATVGECVRCNYRLRAQPWAHLLNADRFVEVFPESFYSVALNAVTPFQLKQFVRQAGFDIQREHSLVVGNEPPPALLLQFRRAELRTFTVSLLLRPRAAAVSKATS